MEDKLKNLKREMDTTIHKGRHFTEVQKRNIKMAVHLDKDYYPKRFHRFTLAAASVLAVLILTFLVYSEFLQQYQPNNGNAISDAVGEWEPRQEYMEGNELKFSLMPDPSLEAGKPYGYIFSFKEQFEKYKGKELAIFAVNKETGERITALPPELITETSPGYSSLQRFTVSFEIPYGGLWKYEVFLGDKVYGDAILEVKNRFEMPEDIPEFVQPNDFEMINWDQRAAIFNGNILGNERKSGVIGADAPSLTGQKWMWHLWGNKSSELTVVGFHRESSTVHSVLEGGWKWKVELGGGNNGADAHAPTTVKIPQKGEWAILLYDGEELFDILIYDINE
jgi:hypothetical protein